MTVVSHDENFIVGYNFKRTLQCIQTNIKSPTKYLTTSAD